MMSNQRTVSGGPGQFLGIQFDDHAHQLDTVKLGMWAFLVTEILFFGGLFAAYAVLRANNPAVFHYGQYFLDWRLGGLNTAVLITSSLTAAWAVRSAQRRDQKTLTLMLLVTILCAMAFMVVKYFEYSHKLHHGVAWGDAFSPSAEFLAELPAGARAMEMPPHMGRFFSLYFVMTGLHGIHVLVGIGVYVWLLVRARRGDFSPEYYGPVDVAALYWHLVDMIWIFLFPLYYLIG